MVATADRVIVELEARLDRYERDLRRAQDRFDRTTRQIAEDSRRMAREIERNSGAAGRAIKNLAATFAAGFSAQQVIALADSYTRFTNQLKVAGLEGENLAGVQDRLFAIGQRYGVQIESLGSLYGRLSQGAKELGATQAELDKFVTGVGAALKIQGAAASESSGALLQLTQALGGEIVRAEEFNSINEGARPILQAVANGIDRFAGSVSKLRREVIDGKVTSAEFFQGFLAGSSQLEAQAAKSVTTVGQGFVILTNALTFYIGQTDEALGASQRINGALVLLADNLGTVATALGVIGAVLVGRFAAGLITATTSAIGLRIAALGLSLSLQGTAATAAVAGRALLAAFGGPVGLAVAALAVGFGYLSVQSAAASAELEKVAVRANTLEGRLNAAEAAVSGTGKAAAVANPLVVGIGNAYRFAGEQAAFLAKQAKLAALATLEADRSKVQGRIATLDRGLATANRSNANPFVAGANAIFGEDSAVIALRKERDAAEALERRLTGLINRTINAPDAAFQASAPGAVSGSGGAGAKPKKTGGGRAGASGPTAAEIEQRFNSELISLAQQTLSAQAALAANADERAELELRAVELARIATESDIRTAKEYSEVQRERLLQQVGVLADLERERIERARTAQVEQERLDLATEDLRNARDILSGEQQIANSIGERRDIALRLLDLQQEEERIRLEAIVAAQESTDAEKEIARRRLASLEQIYGNERASVEQQAEGPLAKYLRGLNRTPEDNARAAEQIVVDQLDRVQDGIRNAITSKLGIKDPILSAVLDAFIQEVILKPIAQSFAGAGGGGGIIGAIGTIAGLFSGGRASGGHVNAGRMYRVNETGVEGFQPAGSGKIIPLGRMRGAGRGGVVLNQTVNVDASGGVNPTGYAEHIKAEVRRETLAIVGAAASGINKTVPGRVTQFERDGT